MKRTALRVVALAFLFGSVCTGQGGKKDQTLVVMPFEKAVKGAAGFPEATRTVVIETMKDEALFGAVLTPEEAAAKGITDALELTAKLIDFEAGSAAKRLLVGFGSGRAHAVFEFSLKDSKGEIWKKTIKSTASFWFNGSTSSATERSELPEGIAKELAKELKKRKP